MTFDVSSHFRFIKCKLAEVRIINKRIYIWTYNLIQNFKTEANLLLGEKWSKDPRKREEEITPLRAVTTLASAGREY